MASHRDLVERLSSLADGLRDQNRVERHGGNQKVINESLARLLEQSEGITVGSLTRSRHFNSSASLMSLLSIYIFIIHSKYFPVSDWLKPHE